MNVKFSHVKNNSKNHGVERFGIMLVRYIWIEINPKNKIIVQFQMSTSYSGNRSMKEVSTRQNIKSYLSGEENLIIISR